MKKDRLTDQTEQLTGFLDYLSFLFSRNGRKYFFKDDTAVDLILHYSKCQK